MCCESGERLDLPPRVIEMLAHYRRLLADEGWGWGEDALPDVFRWARFSLLGPVFEAAQRTGDWPSAVRDGGRRRAAGGRRGRPRRRRR